MRVERHPKFQKFFAEIKDTVTKAKLLASITRLAAGNPGKAKSVGDGVWELRIDYGPVGESITRTLATTSCYSWLAVRRMDSNRILKLPSSWPEQSGNRYAPGRNPRHFSSDRAVVI